MVTLNLAISPDALAMLEEAAAQDLGEVRAVLASFRRREQQTIVLWRQPGGHFLVGLRDAEPRLLDPTPALNAIHAAIRANGRPVHLDTAKPRTTWASDIDRELDCLEDRCPGIRPLLERRRTPGGLSVRRGPVLVYTHRTTRLIEARGEVESSFVSISSR